MKQVKHKILSISLFAAAMTILYLSLAQANQVGAQNYDQAPAKKFISVDKKVRSVNETTFYNNIEKSQKVFFEGDVIEYSIAIENTGSEVLNNIAVVDKLPTNLSLIFYPGAYDRTGNKVTWTIDALKPAEIKTFLIRAKIIDVKNLSIPTNDSVKLTNESSARSDTGKEAGDQASIYVGTGTIPKTGNSTLPIQTALVLSIGAAGYAFRKFARGY